MNKLLVFQMSGAQIQKVPDFSVSRSGSDFFSQVAGVRFTMRLEPRLRFLRLSVVCPPLTLSGRGARGVGQTAKAFSSARFITASGAWRPVHISKPIEPW